MCCLLKVRWKGQGTRFVGIIGKKSRLWRSGNNYGIGSVQIFVKKEFFEKVSPKKVIECDGNGSGF